LRIWINKRKISLAGKLSTKMLLEECLKARETEQSDKMPSAKTIFAITFLLFTSLSLTIPSLPPARLLYEYLKIPQTPLSIWGISITSLLDGITNGFLWAFVIATVYSVANFNRQLKPLPPMPAAPHLTTPPLENRLVDRQTNSMPPAITVSLTPAPTIKREKPDPVHYPPTAQKRNKASWKHEIVHVKGRIQFRYRDLMTGRFIKNPIWQTTSKNLQSKNHPQYPTMYYI
jgi:hypothetical protein